jgi:hypothetical protein
MIYFTPGDIEQMKQTEAERRLTQEVRAFIAIKCQEFTKETGVEISKVELDFYYKEELSNDTGH